MSDPMPDPLSDSTSTLTILIDADACPVKDEIYRVAMRFHAEVRVVSNAPFRIPVSPRIKRVVVSDSFDAADDWIAEAADALPNNTCVVITADILLADRCLKAGARVLKHNGEEFSGLVRGGFLAAAGSSFLGAVKSTVMQIQDILVDILPQGPPDL